MPFLAFSVTNMVLLNEERVYVAFTQNCGVIPGSWYRESSSHALIQWSQEDSIFCHCEQFLDIPNKMLAP